MGWLWRVGGGISDLWSAVCYDRGDCVCDDAVDVLAGGCVVARRDGSVGVGNVDVDSPRHA